MTKTKQIKPFKLPPVEQRPAVPQLPFNGSAVLDKGFSFSFSCFDRTHGLFNLGDDRHGGVVGGDWFVALLDCLKSVSGKTMPELKSSLHDLHPVDWEHANASPPGNSEQYQYWQFRIDKSNGRVIGIIIDGVFYVVWLDPHHNLTDSVGYEKAYWHSPALSPYEKQEQRIAALEKEVARLADENAACLSLLEEATK